MLTFTATPLKMPAVSGGADLAIFGAGHGTAAAMLLGGVPMILVPRNAEQVLLARNIVHLGAGAAVTPQGSEGLGSLLARFVASEVHGDQAKKLAARYKNVRHEKQLVAMIDWIEHPLSTRTASERAMPAFLIEVQ